MPFNNPILINTMAISVFKSVHKFTLWFTALLLGIFLAKALIPRAMAETSVLSLIPLRCPLKFFLDIECPTCGLGRSLVAFLFGRYEASLQFHPMGGVFLLMMILWISDEWSGQKKGRELLRMIRMIPSRPLNLLLLWAIYAMYLLT